MTDRALAASPGTAPGRAGNGRFIVGIPTTGRAPILTPTLHAIAAQSRLPDIVYIAIAQDDDVVPGATDGLPFPVELLPGLRGLCTQRNRILDRLAPEDIILMLDDDFLMAPDYGTKLIDVFDAHPEIGVVTGTVLRDGVVGSGLTPEDGKAALAASAPSQTLVLKDLFNGYGCNFAMRAAPILRHRLRFDEALPFYGWLEDVDFSQQVLQSTPGLRCVRASTLRGVHLGTKLARSPGQRLGYSQIANPIYLWRKGTLSNHHLWRLTTRNFASNLAYALRPRPWTDSRGRLVGNLRALWHLVTFRLDPGRITRL